MDIIGGTSAAVARQTLRLIPNWADPRFSPDRSRRFGLRSHIGGRWREVGRSVLVLLGAGVRRRSPRRVSWGKCQKARASVGPGSFVWGPHNPTRSLAWATHHHHTGAVERHQ